jgi:hypothetical protein
LMTRAGSLATRIRQDGAAPRRRRRRLRGFADTRPVYRSCRRLRIHVSPSKRVPWLRPKIGGALATKKQKARAAAAGKEPPGKPKLKKKTSRGK